MVVDEGTLLIQLPDVPDQLSSVAVSFHRGACVAVDVRVAVLRPDAQRVGADGGLAAGAVDADASLFADLDDVVFDTDVTS